MPTWIFAAALAAACFTASLVGTYAGTRIAQALIRKDRSAVTTDEKPNCWICGEPGAEPERTLLGFKKPVCPPGQGCSSRQTQR